ncbi:helix-turn-helix domain-containing protein [Companilactobacillus alimentarius]|uniref:helix-turn-helix domain-containing protein n=1 Tax=Companilactobacillus alimentarius TaxID=1602 RepID=UPI001F280D01|nr:helix-turn-helix domain-containing protein [Companilactobacillus alimentarius]
MEFLDSFTDLFLSKSEIEKIQLFNKIKLIRTNQLASADLIGTYRNRDIRVKDINLRKAAYQMNKSYGSVYNTFLGIQDDFKRILKKDKYSTEEMFAVTRDGYHAYLTTNSDGYLFLDAIVKEKETSFKHFYETLDSSKATVLRHLKPMRGYLKRFGVRIAYEPMRFVGDEESIRLAIAALYWNATRGYVWPFEDFTQKTAFKVVDIALDKYRLKPTNYITKTFYAYVVMAHLYRIIAGNHVQNMDALNVINYPFPNIFESAGSMLEGDTGSEKVKELKRAIKEDVSYEEQMFQSADFYILLMCVPATFEVSEDYLQSVSKQLVRYNPLFANFIDDFLELIPIDIEQTISDMAMSHSEFLRYKYNLTTCIIGVLALDHNYIEILNLYSGFGDAISKLNDEGLESKIYSTVQHLMLRDKYQSLNGKSKQISEAIYAIAYRFFSLYNKNIQVKVYLELESFFLVYSDLSVTLQSLPYAKIVSDPKDADIIVTANSANPPEDQMSKDVCIYRWMYNGVDGQMGGLLNLIYKIWTEEKVSENPNL